MTEQKNPFDSKFANSQRDTIKLPKKILAKIFLPKKIPKLKILNPKKSPGHLKYGVPPLPLRNSSYKKF